MADEQTPLSNGATETPAEQPKPSLREVAEASWDEVQDAADDGSGDASEPAAGQDGRLRGKDGKFVARTSADESGEQSRDPAPKIDAPSTTTPADPAPQGSSNQPPQHWPEQVRQDFAKLDPWGQKFLLDRHTEMERDYQGKAQAAATAVQFTQSLAPIFQHPTIAGSLQQSGVSPYDAISQWAGFHVRAMDPNPQVRAQLWQELGERMGLNPAAAGQMSQPGQLSEEDLKDPAIRYFADHIGRTFQETQSLRAQITQMQHHAQEQANAEVLKVKRWSIDSFADEKDDQGSLKRPYFDAVLPHLIELYRADPNRDMQQAYEYAIWALPETRQKLLAAQQASAQKQLGNDRARQAVRSNVRGITSPVAKPAGDRPQGLRATLEAAADEVGL